MLIKLLGPVLYHPRTGAQFVLLGQFHVDSGAQIDLHFWRINAVIKLKGLDLILHHALFLLLLYFLITVFLNYITSLFVPFIYQLLVPLLETLLILLLFAVRRFPFDLFYFLLHVFVSIANFLLFLLAWATVLCKYARMLLYQTHVIEWNYLVLVDKVIWLIDNPYALKIIMQKSLRILRSSDIILLKVAQRFLILFRWTSLEAMNPLLVSFAHLVNVWQLKRNLFEFRVE